MKKFLLLLGFLVFLTFNSTIAFTQEIAPTPTPTFVKYDLAYPGILPDHPLYKLKVLRDRISASLISNPLKKIEFYLLQTDKGILATAMLVDKNKIDLAEITALKAEHNFTLISNTFQSYYAREKANPATTKDLIKKLKTASLKHQEVLNSILKRVSKDRQKTFITVIDFSKRNMDTIEKTVKDHESGKGVIK